MSKDSGNLEAAKVAKIYLVDLANKRKLKKSVPTNILNLIEKYPDSSVKDLENRAVKLAGIKNGYSIALKKAVAIGNEKFTLRTFARRRIVAVLRYYSAADVVSAVFSGKNPIIKRSIKDIDRYTLGVADVNA